MQYSAEAFPLYVRDIGMSLATSLTWFLYVRCLLPLARNSRTPTSNFVIALTVPALLGAWTPQGVFAWFAAWNLFGFFATLLFVPETKALTLEELDQVFSVPTRTHAAYQLKAAGHNFRKHVLRQKLGEMSPLYEHEGAGAVAVAVEEKMYAPGVGVV